MKRFTKKDIFNAFADWHKGYYSNASKYKTQEQVDKMTPEQYAKECTAYVLELINRKKDKENMTNLMIQYLRGTKNVKRGVMVAFKEGDNVYVGYSLCMKSDKFDKAEGIAVAKERAKADFTNATPSIAPSVKDELEKFKGRVTRYFKDGVKPVWVA